MQGLKKSDHVEFLDLILSGRSLEIVLQMTVVCHPCVFGKRQVGINPSCLGMSRPSVSLRREFSSDWVSAKRLGLQSTENELLDTQNMVLCKS